MKDKFQQYLQQMKEQEWYQQIQSTYQQLSPEQQTYVKWGSLGGSLIFALYLTFSVVQSSSALKDEYFQKQDLVQSLNQASDEIRRLKGQNMGFSQSGPVSWKTTLQSLAATQGMQPDSIDLMREATGSSQNVIQETLLEVQIKSISIRPLVQLLFQFEHAQPPMKLKGISVESGTADGLLNAKLNLSGYLAKGEKAK